MEMVTRYMAIDPEYPYRIKATPATIQLRTITNLAPFFVMSLAVKNATTMPTRPAMVE